MRKVFQEVTSRLIDSHLNLHLLLGDIGVHGFSEIMNKHPNRILNLGILEQAMVGFAAGLASRGAIPIVHSIAPFIVERPLEQIKLDFGYQGLPGKFVSVGASFDYAKLGATHHCPADVEIFLSIPGAEVWVPAGNRDLESVLEVELPKLSLSYFRLTELGSEIEIRHVNGIAKVRHGFKGICVAIGPTIDDVLRATEGLDLSVISWTGLHNGPELIGSLQSELSRNVIVIEPFYQGGTASTFACLAHDFFVRHIGIPREYIHRYGSPTELKEFVGMDEQSLREKILSYTS